MVQNTVVHLFEMQARNQLGISGGEEFSEKGPNFLTFLNYVQ